MSFFKKFASIITGVVAGFLFGPGAFSLGQVVGGLLFNKPQLEKPEIGEIQQPKSSYNTFIPIVHGGDYIQDEVEISGGVGGIAAQFIDCDPAGGVNVAYREKGLVPSYHFSGALLWCEAIDSPKEVVKIWANEIVAYDSTGADDAAKGYIMTLDEETGVSSGYRTSNNKGLLWNYSGNRKQPVNPYLALVHPENEVPAYRDCCYTVIRFWPQDDNGGGLPTWKALIKDGITGKQEMVTAWCSRVPGFPIENLELTHLSGDIRGQFMASSGSAKDKIEEIANDAFCDIIEVDGKIKDVDRSNPTVWELTEDELGAVSWSAGGQTDNRPPMLAIEVGQLADLASSLKVPFLDPDKNFDQNTANALGVPSAFLNEKTVDTSIVSTLDEKTKWAQTAYDEGVAAKDSYKLSLMPSRLAVGPGDELLVPTPEGVRSVRVVEQALSTILGPIQTDGVSFDRDVYSNQRDTASTPRPNPTPTEYAAPLALVLDSVPYLSDSYLTAGVLVAAAQPANVVWEGVTITPTGGSWDFRTLAAPAIMGQTNESFALGDLYHYADRELEVTMISGILQDSTLARAGANLIAFETGRVISFTDASAIADGVQTISGIKDGRYGSDFDSATIPSGTKFVLLRDHLNAAAPGLVWMPIDKLRVNTSVALEIQNNGEDSFITTKTLTFKANSLRPPAPVHVRLTRDGDDAVLRGRARTRLVEDNAWTTGISGTLLDDLIFKVTLNNGSTTVTQTKDLVFSGDATFEITWTGAELSSLFGSVPPTLSGTIAQQATNLTGLVFVPTQLGHARSFTQE